MIGQVNSQNVPMGCRCAGRTIQDLSATKTSNVSLEAHKTSDISFVTKEGDVVTFFSKQDLTATYSAYQAVNVGEDGSSVINVSNYSTRQTEEFSFSVQGDLNKEEMRDIRKALRTIDKILENFADGKIDKAINKVGKLFRLDSLASIEADLQLERSLTVEQQTLTQVAYGPAHVGSQLSPAALEGGEPIKPDEYVGEAGFVPGEGEQEIDETAAAMAEAVIESGADPVAVAKPADDAFEKYMKKISGRKGRHGERIERMQKLRNRFFEKLHDLINQWEKNDLRQSPKGCCKTGGALFQKAA